MFATTSTSTPVQETSTTTSTTQLSTTTTPTTTEQTVTTTVYIAPITIPLVQPVETTIVVVPTGTIAQPIEVRPIETTSPPTTVELKPKIDMPLTTETRPIETVPRPVETVAPPTSITVPFVPRSSTTAPTPTVPQTILPVETTQQTAPVQPNALVQPQVQTTPPVESSLTVTIPAQASNEQITQLVSSPEVLKALTVDQAEQLFEELDVTVLDNTELEAFTEAIQVAPVEVRKAFEKKVNIFGSQFEDYVPAGSNIPVSERRSLVAAGALIATGTSSRMRRK